jgi:hypothetical protein
MSRVEIAPDGVALQLRVHVEILSVDSFCALLTMLLANPEHRLGRCKQCDNFFLLPATAEGQRDQRAGTYCSPKCRRGHHDGAARKRKNRVVKALEKKRHGHDRSVEAAEVASREHPNETSVARLTEYAQAIIHARKK